MKIKILYVIIFTMLFLTKAIANKTNTLIEDIKYTLPRSIINKTYTGTPKVLNDDDILRYYNIFQLQAKGNLKKADKIISTLDNKILLGYVYYERFLQQTSYKKIKISSISNWLNNYYDTAVAFDVYKIYKNTHIKHKPKIKTPLIISPLKPIYKNYSFIDVDTSKDISFYNSLNIQPRKNRVTKQLDRYLKRGKTLLVKNTLLTKKNKKYLDSKTYAYYSSRLSYAYFMDGYDEQSIYWAQKALKKYSLYFPETSINLGLVYWRNNEFEKAAKAFKTVVKNKRLYNESIVSQASYWLARTNYKLKNFKDYYANLLLASKYQYSFYGILASEELGISTDFKDYNLSFNNISFNILLNNKHGERALALLQFGLGDWAEQELMLFVKYDLKKYSTYEQIEYLKTLITLAQITPMPMLSSNLAGPQGMYYGLSNLSYPIVNIEPKSGYYIDPLLIMAVMRRESNFNTNAVSYVGAVGLMQLMPSTAKMLIDKEKYTYEYKDPKFALRSPTYNVELGQKYLKILLNNNNSENSLIYVLAGWNGGLLNVKKWKSDKFRHQEDALFFIESIPFSETRNFVKKVLTDYWLYQIRSNITPTTVFDLINQKQPLYQEVTSKDIKNVVNFQYTNYIINPNNNEREEIENSNMLNEVNYTNNNKFNTLNTALLLNSINKNP